MIRIKVVLWIDYEGEGCDGGKGVKMRGKKVSEEVIKWLMMCFLEVEWFLDVLFLRLGCVSLNMIYVICIYK